MADGSGSDGSDLLPATIYKTPYGSVQGPSWTRAQAARAARYGLTSQGLNNDALDALNALPPETPDLTDAFTQRAKMTARARLLANQGMDSTFSTGPLGLLSEPTNVPSLTGI